MQRSLAGHASQKQASSPSRRRPPQGRHPFAAIVKPTDRCNLRCRYCYVTHHAPVRAMSPQVLDAVVRAVPQLAGPGRRLHFIWHGGEPLLLGRSFFERVLELQKRYCEGLALENCVQTNGTLLTDELVEYFAGAGFAVSLSLDGPARMHDANRRYADGRGSHRNVLQAIARLRQAGQLVGAVAVLTPASAARVEQIYDFMKRAGVQYRVNPVIAPEGAEAGAQLSPGDYGRSMCKLFDLWFEDEDPPHLDPIHLLVGNLIAPGVWGCDYHAGCGRDVLAFNADGAVYPCGQLAGHAEFLLGNVCQDQPEKILNSSMVRRIRRRRGRLLKGACGDCEYFRVCNGGCLASAWLRRGEIEAPDYFCEGRRELFRHVSRRIEKRLAELCNENTPNNGT